MNLGVLVHGQGAPGEMIAIRDHVGWARYVTAGRDGRFAVRLAPGEYTFRHNTRTAKLEVSRDSFEWSGWEPIKPPERHFGFILAAADPVWPGGAERWLLHMAQVDGCAGVVFTQQGHTGQGGDRLLQKLTGIVPVYHGVDALKEQVDRASVVVDWRCSALRSVLPAQRMHRPRIVRVSHSPVEDGGAVAAHRQAADYVDKWVAVSKSADYCVRAATHRGVYPEVIPNPIDAEALNALVPDDIAKAKAEAFGFGPCDRVATMMCRLSPEKRPEFAFHLARALPEQWKVILAGDGLEFDRLAGMVMRDPVLRDRVVMPGAVPASLAIGVADVVVVASEYESFNYTIAEAWALFKPVASTPVGLAAEHQDWVILIGRNAGPEEALALAAEVGDYRPNGEGHRRWPGVERQETWVRRNLGIKEFRRRWLEVIETEQNALGKEVAA